MKNIIFCADGEWAGPDVLAGAAAAGDPTNVLRTFQLLAGQPLEATRWLQDEQESCHREGYDVLQVAKYLGSAGSATHAVLRTLEGAWGAQLLAPIVRGYTFLSRHYKAGDRIYLVGFSRGAYTVRALAGMISSVGLLNPITYETPDPAHAYRRALRAWRAWREFAQGRPQTRRGVREAIGQALATLPPHAAQPLRRHDVQPARVHAVAVWDTVGRLGIPSFGDPEGHPLDGLRLTDAELSPNVTYGFHAISADEQRVSHEPALWNPRGNLEQWLFPGSHSDVGGGHPEAGGDLANIALDWMVRELAAVGSIFRWPRPALAVRADAPAHEPWKQRPYCLLPRAPRVFPAHVQRHPSLARRQQVLAGCPSAQREQAQRVDAIDRPDFIEQPLV